MSENYKEDLIQLFQTLRKECEDLVQARENDNINDLGFISEFFTLLEKLPENVMKEEILEDFEKFSRKIESGIEQILTFQTFAARFQNIIDEFEKNIDKIKKKYILF